jgi:radical SAM superfamily enzyme YgiQ (UPF0313 family)
MKTTIIALNSKYIHTSLAPWYLKAACGNDYGEIQVLEHTVNESINDVLTSIYLNKPDLAAFSCYIWNIAHVLKLASSLKKLLPKTLILLGGPEVSYDADDLLKENEFVDFVLAGEGEESFPKLLGFIARMQDRGLQGGDSSSGQQEGDGSVSQQGQKEGDSSSGQQEGDGSVSQQGQKEGDSSVSQKERQGEVVSVCALESGVFAYRLESGTSILTGGFEKIDGLVWRQGNIIKANEAALIISLDIIPSPYSNEMLSTVKNRIIYFESSRGCPYSCSYCLSSASAGTRFFALERVFKELDRLVESGVRQIKFVDRTFNCHKDRALAIIKHIIELDKINAKRSGRTEADCNFHFEVGVDLFDDEILQVLASAPKGLFQIEAGVQTVNGEALAAINRITNQDRLFCNLNRLRKAGNINIHTDLIAGLPYEDYLSFGNSFDSVHNTEPNQLQLGFLKFLKGTRMRSDAAAYGYSFNDFPPYEILGGSHIGYNDLIVLKGIAELVERYYNSARFVYSIKFIIKNFFISPFKFYESFFKYCIKNGCNNNQTGVREMYAIFDSFAATCMNDAERGAMRELLRLDFLASDHSGTLPDFMENRTSQMFKDNCFEYLRETDIAALIPEAAGMTSKQIFKKVQFDIFKIDLPDTLSEEFTAVYSKDISNTYMFNYMNRDKVSGRYLFQKINI